MKTKKRGRKDLREEIKTIDFIRKIPPQAAEAEVALLQTIFFDNQIAAKVRDIISDSGEEFYRYPHSLIYRAMMNVLKSGGVIDLVTLIDELRRQGKLDTVGGTHHLDQLFLKEAPTIETAGYCPANAEHYARIIVRKYLLRKIINAGWGVIERANNEDEMRVIIRRMGKIKTMINELIAEAKRRL